MTFGMKAAFQRKQMPMNKHKCLFGTLAESIASDLDHDTLEKRIWDEFGKTCAVLILDSAFFSRTTKKKGIVFSLKVIAMMREVGRRVFAERGALGFRAAADNLFAEFETVEQALHAAFDMHRYFEENPLPLFDDEHYKVCIGIGYGRLLQSEREGMYGDEMNLASKLGEDTAEGGRTLLTEHAYQALKNREHFRFHRKFIRSSGVDLPYFETDIIRAEEP
jgi:adenylate cyclase